MVMFVTIDMNEGKIAPNSFNFAGGVMGHGSGTHASTSTETAALLRGRTQAMKTGDFSSFLDFGHSVLVTSLSICIFTADINIISYLKKNTTRLLVSFSCSEILRCRGSSRT